MSCPAKRTSTTSVLPLSLTHLGKSLVVGKMPSIAEAIAKHDSLAEMVFKLYAERISLECGSLCRKTQEVNELSPFLLLFSPVDTFEIDTHPQSDCCKNYSDNSFMFNQTLQNNVLVVSWCISMKHSKQSTTTYLLRSWWII